MATAVSNPVREAYAALAAHYEAFTDRYPHGRWMRELERLARRHGVRHRRVLDVGCGTGKSLEPLLRLGYDAVGCDISPHMLNVARERFGEIRFVEADLRDLPRIGRFPWVISINDTLNYLLGDDDLALAMRSLASALAPGGLLTFDLNTELGHRRLYEATWAVEAPGRFMCWQGRGWNPAAERTAITDITIFSEEGGSWRHGVSRHIQRWWSDREVLAAVRHAGLTVVARYGQARGAELDPRYDAERHTKVVYFLRAARSSGTGERG